MWESGWAYLVISKLIFSLLEDFYIFRYSAILNISTYHSLVWKTLLLRFAQVAKWLLDALPSWGHDWRWNSDLEQALLWGLLVCLVTWELWASQSDFHQLSHTGWWVKPSVGRGGPAKSALVAGVLAFDFFFVAPSACWSFFLIFHSLRCSLALRRTIPDMGPGAGIGYSCGLCPVWSEGFWLSLSWVAPQDFSFFNEILKNKIQRSKF